MKIVLDFIVFNTIYQLICKFSQSYQFLSNHLGEKISTNLSKLCSRTLRHYIVGWWYLVLLFLFLFLANALTQSHAATHVHYNVDVFVMLVSWYGCMFKLRNVKNDRNDDIVQPSGLEFPSSMCKWDKSMFLATNACRHAIVIFVYSGL